MSEQTTTPSKGCTCGRCDAYKAPEQLCVGAYLAAVPDERREDHVQRKLQELAKTSARHGTEYMAAAMAHAGYLLRTREGAPAGIDELLVEVDAKLHPWGEPGAVPSTQHVWILATQLGPQPVAARVEGYHVVCLQTGMPVFRLDSAELADARFRKRWTPAPPRGDA